MNGGHPGVSLSILRILEYEQGRIKTSMTEERYRMPIMRGEVSPARHDSRVGLLGKRREWQNSPVAQARG